MRLFVMFLLLASFAGCAAVGSYADAEIRNRTDYIDCKWTRHLDPERREIAADECRPWRAKP